MAKKADKNLFVACSGGRHLTKKLALRTGGNYCGLETEIFPDTELRVRLTENVKNRNVYFVQSFYAGKHDVNGKFIELLFAAKTAKELGAKNVFLIAPYLAYMREDTRFRKGEAVSARLVADMLKIFKRVFVAEPHLHRFKSFSEFFPNARRVCLANEVAGYVKRNVGECLLIGPDGESEQWVKPVAEKLNLEYEILKKERFTPRKVRTKGKKSAGEKVVIIDDIISTGGSLIEASRFVKAKELYFIGMHGLFTEGAFKKLSKKGKTIVSNTIPTKKPGIDCTRAIAETIK